MSFDWTEYLDLANALIREKSIFASEEACLRAAISRAYYSAFCAARNRARDIDGLTLTNTGADHTAVKRHYQQSPDTQRKKIGNWLDRLRKRRNRADYVDVVKGLDGLSVTSVTQAREILNWLTTL